MNDNNKKIREVALNELEGLRKESVLTMLCNRLYHCAERLIERSDVAKSANFTLINMLCTIDNIMEEASYENLPTTRGVELIEKLEKKLKDIETN